MACDITSLLSDACTNNFLALAENEVQSRGLILQLFYDATGDTATEGELLQDACNNGFLQVAQNETQFRTLLLQLICNIGG